jgi:hypothetical protein
MIIADKIFVNHFIHLLNRHIMKPVFTSFNLKKSASVIAASLMLSLGSASLQAAPIIEKIVSPTDKLLTVSFVGSANNELVFHLDFENKTGEKFSLIVKNDAGDVVYQNTFSDVHFEKNIRIANEESELHPTFVIRTSNEQVERKFSVKSKTTENYVVTNL